MTNFQAVIFGIFFVTMNGHTYKLFKNILNDVQIEGKGEIVHFDTISVEGQKVCLF